MLSSCLNVSCSAPFRYMNEGRVVTVECFSPSPDGLKTDRTVAHYWLCGACSRTMKVVVENGVASAVPMHLEVMLQGLTKGKSLPAG